MSRLAGVTVPAPTPSKMERLNSMHRPAIS